MNVLHPAGIVWGWRELDVSSNLTGCATREMFGEIVWVGKLLGLAAREGRTR